MSRISSATRCDLARCWIFALVVLCSWSFHILPAYRAPCFHRSQHTGGGQVLTSSNKKREQAQREFSEKLKATHASGSKENADVVIAGLGVAGTALAHLLDAPEFNVIAMDRDTGIASSLRNQKWRQAGPYYVDKPELANRLFESFQNMRLVEERHIINSGAQFLTRTDESLSAFRSVLNDQFDHIPHPPICVQDMHNHESLGRCVAAGGFRGPDSVMDFPELLGDLRRGLNHVRVFERSTVQGLVRDGDRIKGVVFQKDGVQRSVVCNHVVIALGAWTVEMLREVGIDLKIRLLKSHILTVQRELVPRITVWVDDPRVTLVPFKGQTLISNRGSIEVGDPSSIHQPDPSQVEKIKEELASVFPQLDPAVFVDSQSHACLKAELIDNEGGRNQDSTILGEAELGVKGISVVVTGKASLMFAVAEQVKEELTFTPGIDSEEHCHATSLEQRSKSGVSDAVGSFSSRIDPLPSSAIAFTHLPVRWDALRDRSYLNEISEKWGEQIRAYSSCRSLRLVYVYVSAGVEQVLRTTNDTNDQLHIPWEVLEKEQAVFDSLNRALEENRTAYVRGGSVQFEVIGVQKLTSILNRLWAIDPRLVGYLRGETGVFTYDSPKFVEAVIRIARGMDYHQPHIPIVRFDADVLPNDEGVDQIVAAYWQQVAEGERYAFFSGGYCGPNGYDLLNSHAVRTHWFESPDLARQFLRDLTVLGAPQIVEGAQSDAVARLAANKSLSIEPREPQPISGAGLVMSTMAIRRLPPFANMNHATVWVDDWLKRCLHESIGDLSPHAVQRVSGAEFVQDRHPNGLTERDHSWAKKTYIERLARGCLMQALIVDREGTPGPLSRCVSELIVHQRQGGFTKQELAGTRKDFVAAAEQRMDDIGSVWCSENYGKPVLASWFDSQTPAKRRKLIRSVAQDAIDYLQLVRAWPMYRDAIELLGPEEAHWLFARVDSGDPVSPAIA